jgi:hypothetical protein
MLVCEPLGGPPLPDLGGVLGGVIGRDIASGKDVIKGRRECR